MKNCCVPCASMAPCEPRECVHVGGAAQGDALVLGEIPDSVPFPLHHRLQSCMYVLDGPIVILPVLHPLEVRDGDAARVRQDVRQDNDVLVGQDFGRPRA